MIPARQTLVALLSLLVPLISDAAAPAVARGDRMLDAYFRSETAAIADRCLEGIKTLDEWSHKREQYRQQLAEMLGLWPAPPRADLKPVITGKIDHGDFVVEKVQFQSRPGLYVTADLYLPKAAGPSPAILYVCGHSLVKKDGVSFGNKTGYQHHGEWFARNGYVCLMPDTLQLGEIEGIHHGLYRLNMWWWLSRGYTPAGVEAWNGIRCLDYLQSRPEVDSDRIGMTGRSGGGAYTWYTAALDDRVKVVVPVAGITDLQNHIVDGCIEGHCDCMYMTNTYRWDFPQVAAMIAPRPMLISNSDKDTIFPLDGVLRIHSKVREIYRLYKADDKLGLLITEGPHKDTQDLRVPAFRWFNRFLKNDTGELKDAASEKLFEPELLRVFSVKGEPADQLNTTIQETFIPAATIEVPPSAPAWEEMRGRWMTRLREKTFAGWPEHPIQLEPRVLAAAIFKQDQSLSAIEFESQENVELPLIVVKPAAGEIKTVRIRVVDQSQWEPLVAWLRIHEPEIAAQVDGNSPAATVPADGAFEIGSSTAGEAVVWLAPRGVGPSAWGGDDKHRRHILRRFTLLGQTLDGMRVWDVRRAIQVVRGLKQLTTVPLIIEAQGKMAGVALYASLFENGIQRLDLRELPVGHREGPDLLNVQQILDLPATVAMAAERCEVRLFHAGPQPAAQAWKYPPETVKRLGWPANHLVIMPE